jgi:outer membrane protein TolC
MLSMVDAQRAALQAKRPDVQLRGQCAISTILLAKALGGGWGASHSLQSVKSN